MEKIIGEQLIGGQRYEIVQVGSGKGAKKFLRKVGKVAKKVAKFAKKKKLISKGLNTIADLAPLDPASKASLRKGASAAKLLGFGDDEKELRFALRHSGGMKHGKGLKLSGAGNSAWIQHVKKYRAKHPGMSYKDALKGAKSSYKRGGSLRLAGQRRP
jgi:hypothetical protein